MEKDRETHSNQPATTGDILRLEGLIKEMLEELTATYADVRSVRSTVSTLVRKHAAQDESIDDPKRRMARVEKKIGIAP